MCIHFGYINAGKSQIIGILHVISGVWLHFAGNILKTWEIQGKMSANSIDFSKNSGCSIFSQMATLLVAFTENLGYSSQSYVTCVAFSEDSKKSVQDACVLHTLYGTNVGKLGFPISADLLPFGSVEN